MLSFATARAREFTALLVQYGVTISVAGVSYTAIAPPMDVIKTITPGPFNASRTFAFQMKRADFILAFKTPAEANLSPFLVGGYTFEVKSVNDDPVEPSVELRASLRQ